LITETKKSNQKRQIFLEKQLMSGDQYKSMKNWIFKWRPKVANQHSGDYLLLQANGRPFTTNYLRKMLTPLVKQVWLGYSLYIMRHWCAIARLIQSFIERDTWDKTDVQEWLGHEKVSTTDNYTNFAKKYYKNAPFDWIKAILKYHYKQVEENGKKSTNRLKGTLLNKTTEEKLYAPVGIRTRVPSSKGWNDWPLHYGSK
jgi:integrase